MNYKARFGSPLNDSQAQRYGDYLETLTEGNNGELTPEFIVANAGEGTPIYEYFEWDVQKAAQEHWKSQARELMRYIEVIIQTDEGEKRARAFHSIIIVKESTSERVYVPLPRILTDADKRSLMMEEALRKLNSWRRQYQMLSELAHIFAALDEAIEQEAS